MHSLIALLFLIAVREAISETYTVVDTDQSICYNDIGSELTCQTDSRRPFYGQDANYAGNQPDYVDNGDETITDANTGLMWAKAPLDDQLSQDDAVAYADSATLAGYDDWRVPSIKELYSLILFSGKTDYEGGADASTPYIDDSVFTFAYHADEGEEVGDRWYDVQYVTTSTYLGKVMNNQACLFGVNFADGRIKCYGLLSAGGPTTFYVRLVRGDTYGENDFVDNGDNTITDQATGLMWMQEDSGHLGAGDNADGQLNWKQALDWAKDLTYAGHSDWRVPNAKELQSIVDYTRSPQETSEPAIDPLFETTTITDEAGNANWPWYWSSTTHVEGTKGNYAAYLCFGEGLGYQDFDGDGTYDAVDVHGAGSQKSDPKSGDPADFPTGHGPQNDCIRIYNFARLVRDA